MRATLSPDLLEVSALPFLQGDGAPQADVVGGPIGSGLPLARLVVDPDQILTLKRGVEDELDLLRRWMLLNRKRLLTVPPPGNDPCSEPTAVALGHNGETAVQAMTSYAGQLAKLVDALGEIAREYGLTEQNNAGRFTR